MRFANPYQARNAHGFYRNIGIFENIFILFSIEFFRNKIASLNNLKFSFYMHRFGALLHFLDNVCRNENAIKSASLY